MNNIYGQPNSQCGCRQNSYTRPIRQDCERREPIQDQRERCEQLGGTVLRINIPAGAEINLLNLVELASPSGICLILRLPFLGGECGK